MVPLSDFFTPALMNSSSWMAKLKSGRKKQHHHSHHHHSNSHSNVDAGGVTSATSTPMPPGAANNPSSAASPRVARARRTTRLESGGSLKEAALLVEDRAAATGAISGVQTSVRSRRRAAVLSAAAHSSTIIAESDALRGGIVLSGGDAQLCHGLEFRGATARLVFTPATERCMVQCAQALASAAWPSMQGGGLSGKAALVEDLAQECGRLVAPIWLSRGWSASAFEGWMRGVVAVGAWGLLRRVHCLAGGVLSVLAAQLSAVQGVFRAHPSLSSGSKSSHHHNHRGQGSVDLPSHHSASLGGYRVPISKHCAVIVTSHVDSSGGHRMPHSLRALFRTLAVVRPDMKVVASSLLAGLALPHAPQLASGILAAVKAAAQVGAVGVIMDKAETDAEAEYGARKGTAKAWVQGSPSTMGTGVVGRILQEVERAVTGCRLTAGATSLQSVPQQRSVVQEALRQVLLPTLSPTPLASTNALWEAVKNAFSNGFMESNLAAQGRSSPASKSSSAVPKGTAVSRTASTAAADVHGRRSVAIAPSILAASAFAAGMAPILEEAHAALNLQPSAEALAKCCQLQQALGARRAVIVTGRPGSGKSSVLAALSAALELQRKMAATQGDSTGSGGEQEEHHNEHFRCYICLLSQWRHFPFLLLAFILVQ